MTRSAPAPDPPRAPAAGAAIAGSPRVARNAVYNLLGQGTVAILWLLAARAVSSSLGRDALGLVYLALALSSAIGGILDMGLSTLVVREVSARFASDPGYVRRLLRTGALFAWAAVAVLAAAVWIVAPLVATSWVNLGAMGAETATRALRLLGLGVVSVLPRALYTGLLRGLERMNVNNAIDVATAAVQQLGIVVLAREGAPIATVAAWVSASFLLGAAAYAIAAGRLAGWSALVPGWFRDVVRDGAPYAGRMLATAVLAVIHVQADRIVASRLLPLASVGTYGFGYAGVSRASLLQSAIGHAALPTLSSLAASRDAEGLRASFAKLQHVVCVVAVPVYAAIPFFAEPVLGAVFDPPTGRELLLPLSLVGLGYYLNATITIPYVASLATGRPDIAVRSNLYGLLVVLPITAALVARLGLVGAGLSWVVYQVYAYAYSLRRVLRECLGLATTGFLRDVARIALAAALSYGPAWLAPRAAGLESPFASIGAWALATAAYGAWAYRGLRSASPRSEAPAASALGGRGGLD